jgi:hypothetical protein
VRLGLSFSVLLLLLAAVAGIALEHAGVGLTGRAWWKSTW